MGKILWVKQPCLKLPYGAAEPSLFESKAGQWYENSTGVMPILNASLSEHTAKALKFLVTELKADPKKRNRFGDNCLTVCSGKQRQGIKVCVEVFRNGRKRR